MTSEDFFKWTKDRKVCVRGALHIRGRSSMDFWYHTRRGDWLCWVLDWAMLSHPNNVPMWERPWWVVFLDGLFVGREDMTTEAKFRLFDNWDRMLRLTHDDTFLLEYKDLRQTLLGCEIVYQWDWEAATNRVRAKWHDPLAGKKYEPFKTAEEYRPENEFPDDYPIDHMKEVLGDS